MGWMSKTGPVGRTVGLLDEMGQREQKHGWHMWLQTQPMS
jgi:hypothetical protein